MTEKEYSDIISRCVPSEEMVSFFNTEEGKLGLYELAELVAGSPEITISEKYELIKRIADETGDDDLRCMADDFKDAIDSFNILPGELMLVTFAYYDVRICDSMTYSPYPFTDFEKTLEFISSDNSINEVDEKSICWHEIEKWSPDESGNLELKYRYYHIFGKGICFFSVYAEYDDGEFIPDHSHVCADKIADLNLPVPFKTGDIVNIDCTPFAPPLNALIVYAGENWDCCSHMTIFRDSDGRYRTASLKHGDYWKDFSPPVSPLYRLSIWKDDKEKYGEEIHNVVSGKVYAAVSDMIAGDNEKGDKVLDLVLRHSMFSAEELLSDIQCEMF